MIISFSSLKIKAARSCSRRLILKGSEKSKEEDSSASTLAWKFSWLIIHLIYSNFPPPRIETNSPKSFSEVIHARI
jgi:hypothetical protein